MMNTKDENFDDIDLNELFNDFHEIQSYTPRQPLSKWGLICKTDQDDLIEFNEDDCTSPKTSRKRTRTKKKMTTKQMTMYDYASSITFRHKQYYSSLDNSTTTKMITKRQKRLLNECQPSTLITRKFKTAVYDKHSSSDFVDNLLRYLDERSHNTMKSSIKVEK